MWGPRISWKSREKSLQKVWTFKKKLEIFEIFRSFFEKKFKNWNFSKFQVERFLSPEIIYISANQKTGPGLSGPVLISIFFFSKNFKKSKKFDLYKNRFGPIMKKKIIESSDSKNRQEPDFSIKKS